MSELQDLFARLRPSSDSPPTTNYHQPSVSSPILSPPLPGPQPRHSDIMSQNVSTSNTPRPDAGSSDRTANLLNLLKFNQSSSRQNSQSAIPGAGQNGDVQAQAAAASATERSFAQSPSQAGRASSRPSTDNPQDMLLNLLKRPVSNASTTQKLAEKSSPVEGRSLRETTPGAMSESASSPAPKDGPKAGMFSYVNPFDQLHAPSPHSRPVRHGTDSVKAPSNTGSPLPSPLPTGKTQLETFLGIGTEKSDTKKPVTEALSSVAEQADKDVRNALASAEAERATDEVLQEDPEALKEAVHEAAVEIQDELQDGKTKSDLEDIVSKPVAEALQETVDAVAQEGVADSWESAEAEEAAHAVDEHTVSVYNLPMRPFVSLDINSEASRPAKVRNDVVMKIATLKKEFDQIDRTLASASPNYIVYAMAKGGGFRVIRQDDGSNRTNFRGPENVIFHVSISHSPVLKVHNEATETVLATGTSGAVYWTSIPTSQTDSLEDIDLDKRGFIMPPLPSTDENTSTSQLKTRAKTSSRHPEFFAVGRGKSIYIVYPAVAGSSTYINPDTRVIDTQRYLNQRMLKIATGKAGKDFTFSEDDTVIVSLDKHGRLKFWDITDHLALANETLPGRPINMESKVPVMTLWLTSSTAKAWPTSVQFVDKERPIVKGIASRYMLVGLKQNHTIQLWDLGLGKAVQEINLPHANETDPICSIAYHAKSGIIVVGHPTRNSIYLVHLSAPKYTVPSMTQSSYLHGLVNKEPRIPRPESTAIMSGLREISLEPVGSMRSIDILSPSPQTVEKDGQDEETVFEVYVMHSRGVTCLNLKKQDFGWNKEGKVIDGHNAEAEGVVVVGELQVSAPAETGQVEETKSSESNSKVLLKPASKPDMSKNIESAVSNGAVAPSTPKASASTTKTEKKKDKKKPEHGEEVPIPASKPPSYADALSRATAPVAAKSSPAMANANGMTASAETAVPPSEQNAASTEAYVKALKEQMDELWRRMDEQRRIAEAANAARQEAVLRLVSATLTENVEKSLHSIVSSSINEQVIPAISNVTAFTLEAKIPNAVAQQVAESVPGALQKHLPDAIAKSLQSPGVLQTISEHVAAKLAPQMEKDFTANFKTSVLPSFTRSATDAARSGTAEVERRVHEQLRQVQVQNQRDQTQIDQLTRLTSELSSTITSMAGIQGELHQELAATRSDVRQLKEQVSQSITAQWNREAENIASPPAAMDNQRGGELESIAQLITQSNFEEATIRWLQSAEQSVIFDRLFAPISPASFLPQLNPIVNLSVSAAVSSMLSDGRLEQKMGYLETVLEVVNPADEQIVEYAPRMMEVLKERVSDMFMRVAEERPSERQLLSRLRTLVRNVGIFKTMVGAG